MFERDTQMPRAITANGAADLDGTARDAIEWTLAQHREQGGRILLFVPRKTDFQSEPSILTRFAKRPEVVLDTARGSIDWSGGTVLAAWPQRDALARIDGDGRTRALCVIPWGDESVLAWARAHDPELLGGAQASAPIRLDPVVEQGMLQLTRMVNHANSLAGALDHRDAVAVLRELHRGGYRLPHDDLYAWALGHGWRPRGAERLRDMAERIDAGRVVQMKGPSPLLPNAVQRWADLAAGSAAS